MQDYFYTLSERLFSKIKNTELLLCNFEGENSDFVRFNHNKVRQAGNVVQQSLSINLIRERKQSSGSIELSGHLDSDITNANRLLDCIRRQLECLPEDPYLNFAEKISNTEHKHSNSLPKTTDMVDQILTSAVDLDLVGILANGEIYNGFSNSMGQRNWHSSNTFNVDWSCYLQADKAVKNNYSGFIWDNKKLSAYMDETRTQLKAMSKSPIILKPGCYRAYIAPGALNEIIGMMSWGGFGLKSHRTSRTPLIKMITENKSLSTSITLTEENDRGLIPDFTESGFILPKKVCLIDKGFYKNTLSNARSAKEYSEKTNCSDEFPQSINLSAGTLASDQILQKIDKGLYINNLWYCNFSDRNNCKITGMTRFACYWVQNGEIHAPINVMRFDDSVYDLLGENLIELSENKELLFDPSSYHKRASASAILPGALVSDLSLTL